MTPARESRGLRRHPVLSGACEVAEIRARGGPDRGRETRRRLAGPAARRDGRCGGRGRGVRHTAGRCAFSRPGEGGPWPPGLIARVGVSGGADVDVTGRAARSPWSELTMRSPRRRSPSTLTSRCRWRGRQGFRLPCGRRPGPLPGRAGQLPGAGRVRSCPGRPGACGAGGVRPGQSAARPAGRPARAGRRGEPHADRRGQAL